MQNGTPGCPVTITFFLFAWNSVWGCSQTFINIATSLSLKIAGAFSFELIVKMPHEVIALGEMRLLRDCRLLTLMRSNRVRKARWRSWHI